MSSDPADVATALTYLIGDEDDRSRSVIQGALAGMANRADSTRTVRGLKASSQVRGVVRTGWPVSRVLFPDPLRSPGGDHPSTGAVADTLQRSTRVLGRAALGVRAPGARRRRTS